MEEIKQNAFRLKGNQIDLPRPAHEKKSKFQTGERQNVMTNLSTQIHVNKSVEVTAEEEKLEQELLNIQNMTLKS